MSVLPWLVTRTAMLRAAAHGRLLDVVVIGRVLLTSPAAPPFHAEVPDVVRVVMRSTQLAAVPVASQSCKVTSRAPEADALVAALQIRRLAVPLRVIADGTA